MIKKASLIVFGALLLQLFLLACCPDPGYYYYRITDIQTANCQLQSELGDSAAVTQGEFRLKLNFTEEVYAQLFPPSFFINPALALSCEENFMGLDNKVTDFTITADQDIYNTIAGDPIDYRRFDVHTNGFETGNGLTVEEWLHNINNSGYLSSLSWYFRLIDPIDTQNFIRFKINMLQENGKTFEIQSTSVKLLP